MTKIMTKEDVLNYCCDLFGYSADDFSKMSYDEIWDYLTKEQQREINLYHRGATCEKCGGGLKVILLGDESKDKCVDCGWINE